MKNFIKDILLIFSIICISAIGRLSLLAYFGGNEPFPSFSWFLTSLRFDLMTAAYLSIPTAILSIIYIFFGRDFPKLKTAYAVLCIVSYTLLCVVNFCFFSEYNSQFNYWVFGIFFDDFHSILNAILKDYPVLWICLSAILFIFLAYKFVALIFRWVDTLKFSREQGVKFPVKILCTIAYVVLFLFMMRGGNLWGRPMQNRDTAVEPSEFLNKLIPSAAYCLKTEIVSFLLSANSDGLAHFNISEADIPKVIEDVFGKSDNSERSLQKYVERSAGGSALKTRTKRIFFIVGEGHSAWPTYEKYASFGLMPQTSALCKNFLHSKKVLSSDGGTMASVSSLASGLPYCGLDVRGVINASTEYSIANIFKGLGYSSTFYYAGQSTWMRLGEFLRHNNFSEVVGGESMGELYGIVEWGIRDKDMFNFILSRDIPENSFNMILTVSNHPPYDVDLKAEGCPAELKTENDVKLYHMWYADKQIGHFTTRIMQKYPDSIIVITGDHSARTLPKNTQMDNGDSAYVPAIFVGKQISEVYGNMELSPGQHLDIIPTLVELIAPKGFRYKAWGDNLLTPSRPLPAMTHQSAILDGNYVNFNSSSCPDSIKELARKYFAIAYYKSIQQKARKGN